MELIGYLWNDVIVRPMVNGLVLLYWIFFNNFGLSIIVFTVIVRAAMVPLTVRQARQMKAMASLQPKMKEIQERHRNDKARVSQETMRLYKEQGVNPLGCLGPIIIQFPIFIGLLYALRGTLTSTPENLANLAGKLYSWIPGLHTLVPIDGSFLWMDLAKYSSENPLPFLLPVLVGGSMWIMQKMTPTAATSPQQQSTNRMMLWMMPIVFGFFTLNFPAGLALYWIVSNIVGIVIQGFITGWGPVRSVLSVVPFLRTPEPVAPTPAVAVSEEAVTDDRNRDDSKDTRRSNRDRPKGTRRRARGSRNRRR